MGRAPRDYDDIPGTYVFDAERAKRGYALNMFCKSLDTEENREAFKADEDAYLDGHALTPEQREAVRARDWLTLLEHGGNMFYLFKIAILDGRSMQYVGGQMSGVTEEEFKAMMLNGGRSVNG